uniref:Tetratricopeptide repeat protein 38 n=1 Tax=Oryza meridionalis TaxID=40149 RepID=A0A0E0D4R8_9ORYZ
MAAAAREGEVRRDMWGQEYRTASGGCAAALEEHYAHTMSFGRGRGHAVLRAAAADPRCALASSLAAHHVAPRDPARAAAFLAAAADNLGAATEYERAVFRALTALIGEERDEQVAIERHFELLKEFPRDLMSLKRAQLICFYMGRPDTSLKFVEQVLPENQDQNYIYGMLAFPLLELGRMDDAEKAARKGLAINKNDCWSQHNLCHVFQQECHFKEATEFMKSCSPSWAACSSFMLTHNWWHVAVCYLEGEFPTCKVLEIYDHNFMTELEKSDCEAAEVYLNALGLLLRLHIRGQVDLAKDRLAALLDALTNELAEAVYEYGKGEHKKVFDILGPDFDALSYKMIGASDEQVDVFNEVWYTVLINTGESSKAIEVLEKQTRKREGAPFLWRLLEKAYSLHGRAEDASVASEKANALQASFSQ